MTSRNIHIGPAIKHYRKKAGKTLQQVADAVDSSKGYMHDLEAGRSKPSFEVAWHIAKFLGTTTDDLVRFANRPRTDGE